MAPVALCSSGVIDVIALITAPIIRARDVTFAESLEVPTSVVPVTPLDWFALVALLAHVPEIKVQKMATGTVPLSVLPPFLTSVPGTRTRAVLLLTLLIGLLLGIGKYAL
jgi:hypothetical protein